MERRSIIRAYATIRPDDESKNRMLKKILLSSEITPSGKDERKMHKRMKPMVIAATIVVMIMLMGCGILVRGLQNWKIGEHTARGEILDKEGNVLIEKEMSVDVISIHGLVDSPTYLAHQEWFEFLKTYDPDLTIMAASDEFRAPDDYYAYNPYSQEMVDKIDEIAEKYGLNLLGSCAHFQRSEKKTFHECLGIRSLLVSDNEAVVRRMSGYFYEAGNFKVEFDMEMLDQKNHWPYTMNNTIYYSRKDNFDDTTLNVGNMNFWEQWTYTTSTGFEVLIASYEYGAIVFCEKEESIIYVQLQNHYETDYNYSTQTFDTNIVMTREQLEDVVDLIDFSIEVDFVNMDLARDQLEQFRGK